MGTETKIEWCDHTFNPWMGCTLVSPECTNCYAKTLMDDRYHKVEWGPKGTRVLTSEANWRQPAKWNREAASAGVKRRVFCASLADVFEDNRPVTGKGAITCHDLNYARQALFNVIKDTPNLIWLLLTKRPKNIRAMVPEVWLKQWPDNVVTGTSAGCQWTADVNFPALLDVPGQHFLSCEPMLGPVELSKVSRPARFHQQPMAWEHWLAKEISWVICGGESGLNARPMHPSWVRSLRDQCVSAGVPFFFKQWGEWADAGPASSLDFGARVVEMFGDGQRMVRLGRGVTGRELDGRVWDEVPEWGLPPRHGRTEGDTGEGVE